MKANHKIRGLVAKVGTYKYAALILMLGIILMVIPTKENKQQKAAVEKETVAAKPSDLEMLEARLEAALRHVDGVGDAKVLLTLSGGMTYEYQSDIQSHTKEDDVELQKTTVLAADGSGKQSPIIVKTIYPTYQGALVLCQGADSAAVKLNVINAISDLTGLGSDKISVIKMKEY